jgi:hypothetical protein
MVTPLPSALSDVIVGVILTFNSPPNDHSPASVVNHPGVCASSSG